MNASSTSRRSMLLTCPTCNRRFPIDQTPVPPFCSERCQLIDLGRWLDEEIGLPHEGEPGETPVEERPGEDPLRP